MEAKMAMAKGENGFMGGLERLTDILTGVAEGLDNLAESFNTSDEELAELNAGKTEEEIAQEDEIAAQIAAPLVSALDSMSIIINGATAQVAEMTAGLFGSNEKADA
jgi:hypothetical protein